MLLPIQIQLNQTYFQWYFMYIYYSAVIYSVNPDLLPRVSQHIDGLRKKSYKGYTERIFQLLSSSRISPRLMTAHF